ncbi:uncharacterized protein LODBEIA_P23650 [Lodderomyces beijingensis]|uniref:AP-3 complex subunit delta n=1 Tax=Lodderomyces beijingensis TaxID=1775926 RepID=A0ABP0ZJ27_9ASCO
MSFQLQNSDVLARLKPFGISFEKSLSDLIKGIRAHSKESPESLAKFLEIAIQECKSELYTTDLETKAMAVLKSAYLEMYGFDMSWCNFQILEVMSSSKFQQKRIGYLAAIQSFKNEQDLLILATNQFKKDLNSSNHVEVGLALSGVATIVTPSLSRDINDDVLMKLNHSKPYIRKKAILAMYKIFLKYPESLRVNFQRVIDMLDDSDISVVSATVNVICEISKDNPKIFLNYLPKFFAILEETKNNWLIIRILKLFQSLSKVEPRMKKKILPAIIELMLRTQASSLIYECINCAVNGNMLSSESSRDKETAKLCINQLMNFFTTKDSNLKFVGLIALINILKKFPVFINSVDGVSDVVMDCLNDSDIIIKRKSLEVSNYLVNEDNIVDVVKSMLLQLIPDDKAVNDTLKSDITLKILEIASHDNYGNIPNFKWYLAVLNDILNLTLLTPATGSTVNIVSTEIGNEIANALGREFVVLATKVPSVRANLLRNVVTDIVLNQTIFDISPVILRYVYWILGEYIDELEVGVNVDDEVEIEDEELVVGMGKKLHIFNSLINHQLDQKLNLSSNYNFPVSAKILTVSDPDIIKVLIQALIKIFSGITRDFIRAYSNHGEFSRERYTELSYLLYRLISFLKNFETSMNYEVQERALSWLEFLKVCQEAMTLNDMRAVKALEAADIENYRKRVLKVNSDDESSSSDSSDEDIGNNKSDSEEEDDDGNDDGYENLVFSSEEEEEVEEEEEEKEGEKGEKGAEAKYELNPFAEDTPHNADESHAKINSAAKKLPMLVSHILPSFFNAFALNPVSKNAQRNIFLPSDLDLDSAINPAGDENFSDNDTQAVDEAYNLYLSESEEFESPLIELSSEDVNKKSEKAERLRDDPFYLDDVKPKKKSAKKTGTESYVQLSSESPDRVSLSSTTQQPENRKLKKKSKVPKIKKEKVTILGEETILSGEDLIEIEPSPAKKPKPRHSSLRIDSSTLAHIDLDSNALPEELGDGDEYDVDLDALRKKLAQTSVEPEKKRKKKKKDTEKKEKTKKGEKLAMAETAAKEEQETKINTATTPETSAPGKSPEPVPGDSEDPSIIAVKPKKKTKTKKTAVIID